MKYERSGKSHLLLRFIGSYLIIFILPLIFGGLIYQQAIRITRNEIIANNNNLLGQVREVLDGRLHEINNISKKMVQDPTLNSVIYADLTPGSRDYYKVYQLVQDMPDYLVSNEMIFDHFIFLSESNTTISSNAAFGVSDAVYGSTIGLDNMSYDAFRNFLWSTYHNHQFSISENYTVNGKKKELISLTQSLPYGYRSKAKAVIMLLIDADAISSLLKRCDIGQDGIVYIRNESGETVYSISAQDSHIVPEEISDDHINAGQYVDSSNKNMIILSEKSNENEWSYILVTNPDHILSKITHIRNMTIGILLISFVLVILVATLFSYFNIRPIRRIAMSVSTFLGTEISPKNEYISIEKGILKLVQNNKVLLDEVRSQTAMVKAAYLRKLISGEFSKVDVEKFMSLTRQDIKDNYVQCMIMNSMGNENIEDLNHSGNTDAVFVFTVDRIKERVDADVFYYPLDRNSIALLIIGKRINNNDFVGPQLLNEIVEQIGETYLTRYSFSLGKTHRGIECASDSYREATFALEYNKFRGLKSINHYRDIPETGDKSFYYPVDIELRLISLIRSNESDEVQNLLKKIHKENFENRTLSLKMATQLVYSMKSTMIRGFIDQNREPEIRDILNQIEKSESINEISNLILTFSYAFTAYMNQKIDDHDEQLIEAINKNIETHFTSSQYTLWSLADALEVSQTNIYQFFKHKYGVTFSEFLEKKRLDLACEMLLNTDETIAEISEAVGYSSDMSFRRAFKRVLKITPSKYRTAAKKV